MRATPELLARPQVQLALVLASAGCRFVVVGGTARYLLGAARRPRDLDIVVGRGDLGALHAVLVGGVARSARVLVPEPSPHRVVTGWCSIDVFVEDDEPDRVVLEIDGVRVRVARG